jgi:hypothetical protein
VGLGVRLFAVFVGLLAVFVGLLCVFLSRLLVPGFVVDGSEMVVLRGLVMLVGGVDVVFRGLVLHKFLLLGRALHRDVTGE